MASAGEFVSFWSPPRWRREYGFWDPKVYSKGYHRARDIAGGAWPGPVPALRPGRVVGTGYGAAIGYWIAIQTSRNRVDGYCHMFGGALPAVGTDIPKMGDLPRLARKGERTGSAWSGEHLHFLVTDTLGGVPNASGWDTNPDPLILAELATVSGVDSKPFIPEKEETDMEIVIMAPNGVVVHMAPGAKHDFASPDEYARAQADIEFIREWGGTDAMPLPDWGTLIVHPVTWERFKFLCSYFNVPEGIEPVADAGALTAAQIQTIAAGAAKVAIDSLVAAMPGVTGAPTAIEVAAVVEAQLRDDFAAVAVAARSALDGATIRAAGS